MASEFNGVIFFVNKSDVNFNFFWDWENIMDENKQDKVGVNFKFENGLQIYIDIPKFATAKGLVDICSKRFRIDKQKHRINLTHNNISLTSGDNGQVLEFANGEVINISAKERTWIKVYFLFASKQKISLEIENGSSVKEVVEVLRQQCKIPNNYVIHLIQDARILDNENYLFTDGETILVFLEDKDKDDGETILVFLEDKDKDKDKSKINWKFIFSSSPFLVLTLLALILQWHIAFVISFLVISLVLVAIGLWPKIKTCCPREISFSYETENQNSSQENISQNLNLERDDLRNHDRIDE